MASGMPDADWFARLSLSHAAEPGDPNLGRRIHQIGARATVEEIKSGVSNLPNASWLRSRLSALDDPLATLQSGARYITPGSSEWPRAFDDLGPLSPIGLFAKGSGEMADFLSKSISVVGTRSASSYGKHVTAELSSELAHVGFCIVSGAAFGVDAVAHKAALEVGGKTLAVLPGGVDDDYPLAHHELLADIRASGLAVSEVPNGAHPTRPRFLQRNRVIAALTPGTLITEAPLRSGALNTARWASSLLRIVMAVPGAVHAPMSMGTNRLIREREAELVASPDDAIECLGPIGEAITKDVSNPQTELDLLAGVDSEVFEALPARRGITLERLTRKIDAPANQIAASLGRLQLQGLARQTVNGWVVARHALYANA